MFLNPRDNPHLAEEYLESLARLPERQRKRFYEGVYIDDLDGALFSYEIIARARVTECPVERRTRVVVAVDPSGAKGEDDTAPTRSVSSSPRSATIVTPMCLPTARCAMRRWCGPALSFTPPRNSAPTASSPRRISAAKWWARSSALPAPV